MKADKETIKLLMHTANEKANEATKLMQQYDPNSNKRHFYHGEYMAYASMYTMLENMLKNL